MLQNKSQTNLLTVEKTPRVLQNGLWMYYKQMIMNLLSQLTILILFIFCLFYFMPVKNELKYFKAVLYGLFLGQLRKTSYSKIFLLNFDPYNLTQQSSKMVFFFSFCFKSLSLLLLNLVYLQQTFAMAIHF